MAQRRTGNTVGTDSKAQVAAISTSVPTGFYAHTDGETGLRTIAVSLPAGSVLYTNNAHTGYARKDLLVEATSYQR